MRYASLIASAALGGLIALGAATMPATAAAQASPVVSVSPDSIAVAPGGAAGTVRVTLRGVDRITGVRITAGRRPAAGIQVTTRRVGMRRTRSGMLYDFELAVSAAATAGVGRYSVALLLPSRTAVPLPLALHVAQPPRQAARTISAPTGTASAPSAPAPADPRRSAPALSLALGCRQTTVPLQNGTTVSLGELSMAGDGPYTFAVCAGDGYARYDWEITRVIPAPGSPQVSDLRASGEQATPQQYRVRLTRASPKMLVRIRLRAALTPAGEPVRDGEFEVTVSLPDLRLAGQPTITRYWTTSPRPGSQPRLVGQGVFDPALTEDTRDGEFWIEGRNLDGPGLRIRLFSGTAEYEATPLGMETVDGMQVVRAKLRDFRTGRLDLRHMGGSSAGPTIPRLGYWAFPTSEFSALMSGLSCRIGDPPGELTVVMPGGRRVTGTVPPLEGFGFAGRIVRLNSREFRLHSERGAAGETVVLVLRIEFETDGHEFDGMVGGLVPLAGDLIGPVAEFRTTLRVDPASGRFVAAGVASRFDAEISLRTAVGDVSIGELKQLVLANVNAQLAEVANQASLGEQLATFVNQQAQSLGGAGRIRYVDRLPDDGLYIEYER